MKKKAFLLFFSVVVSFVVVELGLRLYNRLQNASAKKEKIVVVDKNGLQRHEKNQDIYFFNQESGRQNHIITNHEGFIGTDWLEKAPTNTKRIAFLGDSFVEAVQVDYDKNFVNRLAKKMVDEPFASSTRYETMNFGVQNQGPVEELLDYRAFAQKYHPDVVVLGFFLGNDFSDSRPFMNRSQELLMPSSTFFALTDNEIKRQFDSPDSTTGIKQKILNLEVVKLALQICKNNGFLFKILVKTHIFKNPFKDQDGAVHRPFNEIWLYADESSAPHRQVINFTGSVIKELGNEVAANGGHLVVVVIPTMWQVDKEYAKRLDVFDFPLDLSAPSRLLKQAIGTETPTLDLTDTITKAVENKEQIFFFNRGHFTDRGHEVAADELYSFLRERKVILGL